MVNIADCIRTAADAREVDRARAEGALNLYDDLVARYETVMPIHQAQARASADLREATKRAARARFHAVLNQLQSMRRLKAQIEGAPDPVAALRNLLEYSETSGFTGESVASLQAAYIRSINAGLQETLRKTGRDLLGNSRDRALLMDVVRELHLEDTGSAEARRLADAIREQQNRMRRLFNAHGGDVGDLSDYGVPHSHNAIAMERAGFEAWRDFIADRIDWTRIENHDTGQPFAATAGARPPDAETETFLREVWEGITTAGWNSREPAMAMGGKALYNRRADHRVLHFRSGSDWIDYNARFGMSDPFSAMMGGLHGMARDVAMMRVLGPNPKMGLEYAIQVAQKRAAGDARLTRRVNRRAGLVRSMLGILSGSNNVPQNEIAATFLGGTRQVLTSIQLGSALLSSTTDVWTVRMGAEVVGMNPNNVLSRATALMASPGAREAAAAQGYIADTLADAGAAASRYLGETLTPELTERLSSFTLRASGLSFWTDQLRNAFRMEMAAFMAQNADRALDQVDAPLRKILTERGITPADWEALRDPQALFRADNGGTFLNPDHWRATTALPPDQAEQLATRLQMIVEEQLERAVPSVSIEGRAYTLGDTAPGTFMGELARSTAMYKSFALSLTLNQYRRFLDQGGPWTRAAYFVKMATGLVLMGALAVQLKEIAKGRDPRPMTDGTFWMAALFQSGGLGIFGDFFAAETSRAGGGLAETIGGPVVGLAGDVTRLAASNVPRAIEGDPLLIGRDLTNFLRYNTPVLSSLWYERLAFDRLVADQVQQFLDPQAHAAWRRAEQRALRDYGTQDYWARGALRPDRAPDLSNALRTRQ